MANENVVIDLLGTPHTNGVVSCAYNQVTNEITCTYADDTTQTLVLNDKYTASGTLNGATNIATFTRSDGGTFDVDLSDLQETETFLTKVSNTIVYDGEVGPAQIIDLSEYAHSGVYIPLAEKGVADGVATLDGTGLVPTSQLPASVGSGIGEFIDTSISIASDSLAISEDDGSSNNNIGIGQSAGRYLTVGADNILIGTEAGIGNTIDKVTGSNNTVLGAYSGSSLTSGGLNVLIGYQSGANLTTESSKLKISNNGTEALIDGDFTTKEVIVNGTSVVTDTLTSLNFKTIDGSIAISHDGSALLNDNGTDNRNVGIGQAALNEVITGAGNVAIGFAAGADTTGSSNTFIGNFAGNQVLAAHNNILIGDEAGNAVTTQSNQLVIGNIDKGGTNLGLIQGDLALDTVQVNGQLTATNLSGDNTGDQDLTGYLLNTTDTLTGTLTVTGLIDSLNFKTVDSSIAISEDGTALLNDDGSNNSNIAIGSNAGKFITSGENNIAMGFGTLDAVATSSGNIALGFAAGSKITGAINVAIGTYAGNQITTGHNNICIGDEAGNQVTTQSNQLRIGNIDKGVTNAGLIEGDMLLDTVKINGDLTVTGDLHLPGVAAQTTDPLVAGQVWSNAGIMTISAG